MSANRCLRAFLFCCVCALPPASLAAQTILLPQVTYTFDVYPKPALPGINTYLVVTAHNPQDVELAARHLPLNERSLSQISVMNASGTELRAAYKTGSYSMSPRRIGGRSPDRTMVPARGSVQDSTSLAIDIPAARKPVTLSLLLRLRGPLPEDAVDLRAKLEYPELTDEEFGDYSFVKEHGLCGKFRVYCPPDALTYDKAVYAMTYYQNTLDVKTLDIFQEAMPDDAIDVELNTVTIEKLCAESNRANRTRRVICPICKRS
ncbi:MAG: hypothetical protein QM811_25785 [Pirellulales bacterium]